MLNYFSLPQKQEKGFTVVEVLVALTLLLLVLAGSVPLFYTSLQGIALARTYTIATAMANEQMETIRNMPYSEIGTTTGWPQGSIPYLKTTQRGDVTFTMKTTITYADDPYDGKALPEPGQDTDLYPYDYKKVKISVNWNNLPCPKPVTLTSNVAPKGPETASDTGTIIVKVIDANGQPVSSAKVQINNKGEGIAIEAETAVNGLLQVPALPPDNEGYHISATKYGYSTDYTNPPTPGNPNPTNPNLSVVVGEVSKVTLAIDQLSSLSIQTNYQDSYGNSGVVPNASFNLTGGKLIGTEPDTAKYSQDFSTNSSGALSLNNLEWDDYTITLLSSTASYYQISEVTPSHPIQLLPNTSQSAVLLLRPNSLMVTVKDARSGSLLVQTSVKLSSSELGYEEMLTTNTEGQALFTPLAIGSYQIEVSRAGYGMQTVSKSVEAEESEEILLSP